MVGVALVRRQEDAGRLLDNDTGEYAGAGRNYLPRRGFFARHENNRRRD